MPCLSEDLLQKSISRARVAERMTSHGGRGACGGDHSCIGICWSHPLLGNREQWVGSCGWGAEARAWIGFLSQNGHGARPERQIRTSLIPTHWMGQYLRFPILFTQRETTMPTAFGYQQLSRASPMPLPPPEVQTRPTKPKPDVPYP